MKEFAWIIVRPDGNWSGDSTHASADDAWHAQTDLPRVQGDFAEDDFDAARAAGYRALRIRAVEAGP